MKFLSLSSALPKCVKFSKWYPVSKEPVLVFVKSIDNSTLSLNLLNTLYKEAEFAPSKKLSYVLKEEGTESFKRVSILKLGPFIAILSSIKSGVPKSTINSIGSIISSTILKVALSSMSDGKGSYSFIKAHFSFKS